MTEPILLSTEVAAALAAGRAVVALVDLGAVLRLRLEILTVGVGGDPLAGVELVEHHVGLAVA